MVTDPGDAILKATNTCICGSDLHLYMGCFPDMKPGDILGHEFMGIIDDVGPDVTKHKKGDRVVACFDIGCGQCSFCKQGLYSCCNRTNSSKKEEKLYGHRMAGFLGYSHLTGGFDGGQAEYVRVPIGKSDEAAVDRAFQSVQLSGQYCLDTLKEPLSSNRAAVRDGCSKAIEAVLKGCQADGETYKQRQPRVLSMLGQSGCGKSTLLDSQIRLWQDIQYTPPPVAWQPVLSAMRDKFHLPQPVELDSNNAFDANGCLLDAAALKRDDATMDVLQQYFMQKQSVSPGDIVGAALPLYDEQQEASVTTSQAVILFKDVRHGLLFRTMNEAELWEVVQEIRGQLRKDGRLSRHVIEFLKAVFGTDQHAELPASLQQMTALVRREILDRLGVLGTPVEVKLPDEDGLADLPGADDDPIHRSIRRWQLSKADGVVLVVQKDFNSCQQNPLDMLHTEKLLQPIADGTTSLMVVLSDHMLYGWERMKDRDGKWDKINTKWEGQEASVLDSLHGRLPKLNAKQGALVADKVPIMTVRALQFAGLMAELQKAQERHANEDLTAEMKVVLLRTGFGRLYGGLAQACREDSVRAAECLVSSMQKLEALREALPLSEGYPAQPQPANGPALAGMLPAGLPGEDAAAALAADMDALKEIARHLKGRIHTAQAGLSPFLEEQNPGCMEACLEALRLVWEEHGRIEAERRVRHPDAKLPTNLTTDRDAQHYQNYLQQLVWEADLSNQHGTRVRRDDTSNPPILAPLLSWVNQISLDMLAGVQRPMARFWLACLEQSAAQVPRFQQSPRLGCLLQMWLQHVVPLVTSQSSTDEEFLRLVQKDLSSVMLASVKQLAAQLANGLKRGLHKGESPDNLMEVGVIKASWDVSRKDLEKKLLECAWRLRVCGPLRALTTEACKVNTLKERMAGDLRLISNEDALDTLQRGLLDVIGPPTDVLRGLTDNIKQGADNLEQLIVLMHRHASLLTKYGGHTIYTFDSFNKELWSLHNFSDIRTNGCKVPLKAEDRWQEALPKDFLPHSGWTVDVDGLCAELSSMVFGVAGQVRVGSGWEDIDLADGQQQAGIIKDMLVRQLLQTVVEELHHVLLRLDGNVWRFQVVSSRVLPSGCIPLAVGYEVAGNDGNYEGCRKCMQPARADEQLVCCDGEYCSYATHLEHLSPQECLRAADPAESWLCPTCQLRGRTV
ncbi:hypothetical protein WJX72_002024 [[Myrmecia] bisecta]|uniref:Alcohol dehydrogenase-like N-terminal domain-containing protein n=1 Tax=[Myrmecia] bisecta TaxID=41462 RepID=A0AAW1QB88_9CHLO